MKGQCLKHQLMFFKLSTLVKFQFKLSMPQLINRILVDAESLAASLITTKFISLSIETTLSNSIRLRFVSQLTLSCGVRLSDFPCCFSSALNGISSTSLTSESDEQGDGATSSCKTGREGKIGSTLATDVSSDS